MSGTDRDLFRRIAEAQDEAARAYMEGFGKQLWDSVLALFNRQAQHPEPALPPPPMPLPRPRHARAGYIYLMFDGVAYKIGKTTNIEQRQRQAQIYSPNEVTIVHAFWVSDMHRVETSIHEILADQHIRGEWFNLTDLDIQWFRGLSEELL